MHASFSSALHQEPGEPLNWRWIGVQRQYVTPRRLTFALTMNTTEILTMLNRNGAKGANGQIVRNTLSTIQSSTDSPTICMAGNSSIEADVA